jgi:hypothetical protein
MEEGVSGAGLVGCCWALDAREVASCSGLEALRCHCPRKWLTAPSEESRRQSFVMPMHPGVGRGSCQVPKYLSACLIWRNA